MTIFTNTFDGGTNNAELTLGNSGGASGNAFTAVDSGITFTNEQAQSGPFGVRLPMIGEGSVRWNLGSTANVAERFYMFKGSNEATTISTLRTNPFSTATHAALSITAEGNLRIAFPAMGPGYFWISPASIPSNEWIRIEKLTEQGTGATTGRCRIAAFRDNSTTPYIDSGWLDNIGLRGNEHPIGNWVGLKISSTTTMSLFMDSLEVRTGDDYTGSFIGPITGGGGGDLPPDPIPPLVYPELPALNEDPWYEKRTSWDKFVETSLSRVNTAQGGISIVKLTQSQYDSIANPDANTLYIIII